MREKIISDITALSASLEAYDASVRRDRILEGRCVADLSSLNVAMAGVRRLLDQLLQEQEFSYVPISHDGSNIGYLCLLDPLDDTLEGGFCRGFLLVGNSLKVGSFMLLPNKHLQLVTGFKSESIGASDWRAVVMN